jgi:hypothetical protein
MDKKVGHSLRPRKGPLPTKASPFFFTTLILCLLYTGTSWGALTPLEIFQQAAKAAEGTPGNKWPQIFKLSRDKVAEEYGTTFAFLFNYTQQIITHSKQDEDKSRGLWYWNLEIDQKLWTDSSLILEFEVDKGKGIDKFMPTFSEFNSNTGESASLYIPELYLEQDFLKDKIHLAAGKLDLATWFDLNEVANSADTQFLSDALVDSLTIPFPTKGIGAMVKFTPNEWLYFESGATTAKSSLTKTGLSEAFNSTLFINEIGLSPKFGSRQGNYRFIFHLVHQKRALVDGEGTKDNDCGFTLDFDQAISEHISLFLRYGRADPKVRDIQHAWSCGAQITEPLPGRKFDCLGIGVAQSVMGSNYRRANSPDAADSETMCEAYYSYYLNGIMTLTPSVQVLVNPGADKRTATAVTAGLRFLLCF